MADFSRLTEDEVNADALQGPEKTKADKIGEALGLIRGCVPIIGTPGAEYLALRGINVTSIPYGCVLWHPQSNLMLSVGRDAGGNMSCAQCLFFGRDGKPSIVKTTGKKARYTYGPMKGSALMLPGAGQPLVCEGVEDALTLHQVTGRTVYAAFGAGNIGNAPVPPDESVTIVADNEAIGQEAALKAAETFTERGHAVHIVTPVGVKDANEFLLQSGAEAVRAMVEAAKPFEPASREETPIVYKVEGTAPANKFVLEAFDDIRFDPDEEWMLEGVLPLQGVAAIYGKPSSFKSFVSFDIGVSVAAGRDWGGRSAEQGPVVYIAAEGAEGLRKRIEGLRQYRNQPKGLPLHLGRVRQGGVIF